jgi:hypothetical protein
MAIWWWKQQRKSARRHHETCTETARQKDDKLDTKESTAFLQNTYIGVMKNIPLLLLDINFPLTMSNAKGNWRY